MCEETITRFLRQHFGFERIPVPTEAVTMLIERDAADLDLATNLSDDIHEIFGFTQFERGRKPVTHDPDPRIWPRNAPHLAVRQVRRCPRSAPLLLAESASDRAGGGLV